MPNTSGASPSFKPYPLLPEGVARQTEGSTVLYKDDRCILVNDAFPKSKVHCLLMPLEMQLTSLNDLRVEHVDLLQHLNHVADAYVRFLRQSSPTVYGRRRFITGYHAIPSLPMLHMHLLSMDLKGPCLKTRKHYNSFATFFFLTSDRVVEDLGRHGRVTLNQDVAMLHRFEDQSMKCLWCGASLSNMPSMRQHLETCAENKSLLPA